MKIMALIFAALNFWTAFSIYNGAEYSKWEVILDNTAIGLAFMVLFFYKLKGDK